MSTSKMSSAYIQMVDSIDQQLIALDQSDEENSLLRIQLKIYRNNAIPIGRLPPEILCEIFRFEASSKTWSKEWPPSPLSQVCHYWRTVAIDLAALWSNIHFGHLFWAEEQMRRSKSHALSVMVPTNKLHELTLPFLIDILTQTGRLRNVWISCVTERQLTEVVNSFKYPPRQLHSLLFRVGPNSTGRFCLPGFFFRSATNSLRRLRLVGCGFEWGSFDIRNLVDLRVSYHIGFPCETRPSPETFITAIRSMTSVRKLTLHHCLPTNDWNVDASPLSISLPHLRTLIIGDTLANTTFLVTQLSIGKHATAVVDAVQWT